MCSRDNGSNPGNKYDEKDAARDTGASNKEVAQTWHQARDDARASGELSDRPAESPSDRASNEPSRAEYGDLYDRLTGK